MYYQINFRTSSQQIFMEKISLRTQIHQLYNDLIKAECIAGYNHDIAGCYEWTITYVNNN